MATDWNEMKQYFAEETAGREFRPSAHYDADSDTMTLYFSNEPDYARRLNSRVTIYLSDESHKLVGCRVKGVRTVLEDIGWFDASIRHGKVRVDLLFLSLHGTFNGEDGRELYRRLGEIVAGSGMEVAIPELCESAG